ncbi:cysteine-rich receptor-like protein kinase 8 [Tanacetum coccineum]
MDVSNAFLHGDLMEEVYIKPPLGYIGKGQKVSTVKSLDSTMVCMLRKYVDGLKQAPRQWFSKLSNALTEFGFTQSKTDDSLFVKKKGSSITTMLIGQVVLLTRRSNNLDIASLRESPNQLEVKKQVVISRSLVEAEYRAMALTCYEVTWFVSLLKDLGIKNLEPVDPFCGNQAALYIVANPIFHARTKHIEVDCHYVRDQLKTGIIKPSYVHTKSQLVDVFTKVVSVDQHTKLLSMLGVSKAIILQLYKSSLIPLSRGSFDVLVGMDRLSKRKFGIVCHGKVVRIPLEGDEILQVHGERTQGVMKTLMNTKTKVSYDLVIFREEHQCCLLRRGAWSSFEVRVGITKEGEVVTYLRFIANFSKIVKPITSLTERDQKYEWGAERKEAFQTLKNDLCDASINRM